MYYRGAAAAIVVYDITQVSFRKTCILSCERIICFSRRTGADLSSRRQVERPRARASSHGLSTPPFSERAQASSFVTLKNWVKELQTLGPENITIAVCGNKVDQEDRRVRALCQPEPCRSACFCRLACRGCSRAASTLVHDLQPPIFLSSCLVFSCAQEVRREEAESFAREIDGIFFETSAKTAINVNKMFEAISRKLPALQAPAFDNLADLRSDKVDPRGGKSGKEAKGGCC